MKILIFSTLLFFLFASPAQAQVIISEVYPAPTFEEQEWIELYNNSDILVDISGWKLYDHFSSKNIIAEFSNIILEPHTFLVHELSTNKLNNSEEKISLENQENIEISSFYYVSSESQKSFSLLFLNELQVGTTQTISAPTKNSINMIEVPVTPIPTPESTPNESIQPTPTTNPPLEYNEITSESSSQNNEAKLLNQKSYETQIQAQKKRKIELHTILNQKLIFPKIEKQIKDGYEKTFPKFSYIVQKKVSKVGVINAIIGGLILLFTGYLL